MCLFVFNFQFITVMYLSCYQLTPSEFHQESLLCLISVGPVLVGSVNGLAYSLSPLEKKTIDSMYHGPRVV